MRDILVTMAKKQLCRGLAVTVIALIVTVEGRHWRAAHAPPRAVPGARTGVLVLGCPPRPDGSLHPWQKWRVDMASRAWPGAVRVIFSGGPMRGLVAEADVMADYAGTLGLSESLIVREKKARTTWENVVFGARWLGDVDQIMVISDALHAARAIRYLREQEPALAQKVVRTPGYRIGEQFGRKAISAAYESPLKNLLNRFRGSPRGRG